MHPPTQKIESVDASADSNFWVGWCIPRPKKYNSSCRLSTDCLLLLDLFFALDWIGFWIKEFSWTWNFQMGLELGSQNKSIWIWTWICFCLGLDLRSNNLYGLGLGFESKSENPNPCSSTQNPITRLDTFTTKPSCNVHPPHLCHHHHVPNALYVLTKTPCLYLIYLSIKS